MRIRNELTLTEQVVIIGVLFALAFVGCAALMSKPAQYELELVGCNVDASTLAESIECENRARAARGRPLRPMPDAAHDGGRDARLRRRRLDVRLAMGGGS